MSILIVGSVAFDTVETPTGKAQDVLGGAATYSSVAASFFHQVKMVAVVGEDFHQEHINFLDQRDINLEGLKVSPGQTFRWSGKYLDNMMDRETLDTQLNVFEHFDPVLPKDYCEPKLVFLANIHPALQKKVLDQIDNPPFVACDTMDLWINTAKDELLDLLPRLDLLIINDEEAQMLSGKFNLLQAASAIMDLGVDRVIIKRGEHGSTLVTKDNVFICAAYPLDEVVDPTGAGDCFAGGFMGELARSGKIEDQTIKRAMVYGSVLASFNVESFSLDRLKQLEIEDIEKRFSQFKDLTEF